MCYNIPSLFLTNCNRVLNKLDELHLVANSKTFDIIALTESWLNEDIDDSVLAMSGYSLFRRDRSARMGGGILCYISNAIPVWSPTLETSNDDDLEIMWLILRPRVLPRPMSVVALAVVYCPPWFNVDMCRKCCRYIIECAGELSRKYPNLLLLICGDFNTLNCSFFTRSLHLKQLVNIATRGENILDKIFTNHDEVFSSPGIYPPLGKSDHRCVTLFPKFNSIKPAVRKIVYRRDLNDVVIDRIGNELSQVNWSTLYMADDVQSQADFFYSVVHSVLDAHAPIKEVILKASDKPWITDHFKSLIDSRNRAHANGDMVNYRRLRNLVNRKRSCLQQVFSVTTLIN